MMKKKTIAMIIAPILTFSWFMFLAWIGGVESRGFLLGLFGFMGTGFAVISAGIVYETYDG